MQASAEERALLSQIVPLTLQHVVREYPHGAFCHWHSAADAPPDRPALRHPAFPLIHVEPRFGRNATKIPFRLLPRFREETFQTMPD